MFVKIGEIEREERKGEIEISEKEIKELKNEQIIIRGNIAIVVI